MSNACSHTARRVAVRGALVRWFVVSVLLIGLGPGVRPVLAEVPEPEPEAVVAAPPAVVWSPDWHRFRGWQYAVTSTLMTGGFILRFAGPDPPSAGSWSRFEEDLIDLVGVRGTAAGEPVFFVSQLLYFGSMAYRLVDSALLPGLRHKNWDVSWQLSWIDLQSFALVAGVLWTTQAFVGRARPGFRDCPAFAPGNLDCRNPDTRGFIAGHVAVATTAAGLTCLHHRHLPLYGGGTADDVACYSMIALIPVMAATRLLYEEHYPSDVLLGAGLGFVAGYVLPRALHYGWGRRGRVLPTSPAEKARTETAVSMVLIPTIGSVSIGGMVVGRY